MTILTCRRCHWKGFVASFSLVAAAPPLACAAEQVMLNDGREVQSEIARNGDTLPEEGDFYLEVVLNQVPIRQIVHFVARQGRLYAARTALAQLGLTLPSELRGTGLVALDRIPGLTVRYEAADQRLHITSSVELLRGRVTQLGYQPPPTPRQDPASRAPGLLLNYDLYAQKLENETNLSGWSDMRLLGVGPGVWRTSQLVQSEGADGVDNFRNVRLDTFWQMDFPESMVSVFLGDSITGSLSWTRSMRFGGLRVSRNFDLQPYRVTVPLLSLKGETALPSTVDLFVDGIREAQARTPPGQFQIVSAPIINGAGTAQMVVTDVTGRRRVVNISFYNSARMLQKGLGDWSVEVGSLREDYGIRSASYTSGLMTSASARYGLTDTVTLEAHGENADGLSMGGVGALFQLGSRGGIFSASYAASDSQDGRGRQYGAGYEWRGQKFNLSLATLRRDMLFRDIGTLDGSSLPRSTSQAFVGVNIGRSQLGASFVRQSYTSDARETYAGLSWAQSLAGYGHISVGVNRDLDGDGGTNAYLYWSMPFGTRHQAWASVERQERGSTATVGASRTLPGDRDGWGWRVQSSMGSDAGGRAEVSQLTRYGEWQAGMQYWNSSGDGSNYSLDAGATGGVLLMKGNVFPMRRVYDAFALVSTDGIPNVPVKLENRFVGETDKHGLLLVTPLNAWENNDLSIDPLNLPADVRVERVRTVAVPETGGATIVRFPMQETLIVELSVRLPNGEWVPPGVDAVLVPGGKHVPVGYDGRMYLESPPVGGRIQMQVNDRPCSVRLPTGLPARGRIDLGELVCQ